MRLEILIYIAISLPLGLLFFTLFTYRIKAHIRRLGDLIAYFFWPYGPEKMLIIRELDGRHTILYDNDFDEIKSGDKTLIKSIYGDEYVTSIPPSEAGQVLSIYDARAPIGHDSPFSYAWRWAVAASVTILFLYFAFITSIVPVIEVTPMNIGNVIVEVARIRPLDPWEILVGTVSFFIGFFWLILNVVRMGDRTVQYSYYISYGINPPHELIIPSPTHTNLGLVKYFEEIGREVNIVIPSEAADIVKSAMKEVEGKTGSRGLAAVILAKLSMAQSWRQTLANVLKEQLGIFKAGETSAAFRLNLGQIQRRMIPIMILIFIVGLVVGFGVGQLVSIGVSPASQPPTAPANQTGIRPAQPPPPPTDVITLLDGGGLDGFG